MPTSSEMFQFLSGQMLQTPPLPTTSFSGQTVIITGANTGLGLEAAKQFAHLQVSHLILACRNSAKGEAAKQDILATASSAISGASETKSALKIEVWPLEMADYASVIAFAKRARTTLGRLDVMVLNAGVHLNEFELAGSGAGRIEKTLTVNVVSTFLLAKLILPKLQETAKVKGTTGHLVFVGSMIHLFAKTQQIEECPNGKLFRTLSDPAKADMVDMADRYYLSKLLLMFGVRDLAALHPLPAASSLEGRRSAGGAVVINDVNPGWCKTELFRNEDLKLVVRFMLRIIGRTGEVGARTLVLASSAGRGSHGKYLSEGVVKPERNFVNSEAGREVQEKFARELEGLLERIENDATKCA